MTSPIERRKSEHVDTVLSGDVTSKRVTTGFERIVFLHEALPELDLEAVDSTCELLGRRLSAPLIVSSMTGGARRSVSINRAIAEACNSLQIGFGVGSQRVALEGGADLGFNRGLREIAPRVPILANFGAAQLRYWDGVAMMRRAIEMIDADGLIVHLNPVQEAVQSGGDTGWSGLLGKIEEICRAAGRPVIVKEVGFGISATTARRLWNAGVRYIDVAGAGGTSWAAVEAERAASSADREVANAFRDWGIPTLDAVIAVRAACPEATIIASGGIRDGVDAAKAIRAGGDFAGIAAGVLAAADAGSEALTERIGILIRQLRIAMFATGSADLERLRRAPIARPLGSSGHGWGQTEGQA